MAVKYLDKYKASSSAKTGGVHNEGLFHIWTPDKNKTEYNQLIAQGKAEYEKDFESTDELRAFLKTLLVGVKTNGSAPAKVTDSMIDEASEDTLYALIANASHDRYRTGKGDGTGSFFDKLHGGWVKAVRKGITEFKEFKKVVKALEAKNLSENQINQFLSSNKVAGADAEQLTEYAEEIPEYTVADFAGKNGFGVTEDLDENGEPQGLDISEAAQLAGDAPSPEEQAETIVETNTFGNNTIEDGLIDNPDEDDPNYFIEEDTGREVIKTDSGLFYKDDNSPYISPDQSTVATQIDKAAGSANAAQGVVDEAVQDVAAGADTAADIQTSVTGGDVSTGVAEQLGWEKGTKEVDGKTVTTFTDPRTNTSYDVDPNTGMLTDTDGNTVSTVGTMNFEENDFAQQFTNAANDFLYGSVISEQAAQSLGFTKTDKGYTGPDGVEYTVNKEGNLVNIDNEVVRSDGFLDYQTQLTNANADYVTSMEGADGKGGLLAEYDKTYTDYSNELRPRLASLDANTAALNEVARDANSPDYYNRLSQLYYDESKDEINRSTRGAQETLQSTYANAGMDPSSPAYTNAIMDLQNKRSEAMVSARRKAILDSYGLGSDMLRNRQSALNSAQTGIRFGMGALGDLYDVKLEGLGVERDMVSTIYEGKKEGAKLGMEGLGVTAGIERDKIGARENQFYKDIDIVTGLNNNTVDTNVTAANTAGAADANATDDYWTGMGWLQTLVDNDFDWRAAGAAIQTQFPDFDTSTLDEKLQVKFGFK